MHQESDFDPYVESVAKAKGLTQIIPQTATEIARALRIQGFQQEDLYHPKQNVQFGAYYFGDHYILVTGIVSDGFLYNDPIDVDGRPGWDRPISGTTLRLAMNASDQRYAFTAVAVGR